MQQLSDIFELVQGQIKERRKKRTMFYLWLSFFILLTVFSLIVGWPILCSLLPVAGLTGFFALVNGIWLYSNSPQRATKRIAQEMELLFGEDWASYVDTNTYAFALSRFRIRYQERRDFLIHLLIFIPAYLYFATLAWPGNSYREPDPVTISIATVVWLPMLIWHARKAFPGRERLARREREAWEVLQLHLDQLTPDKQKRKEKPKREISYRISDDGELVEEEESETIDWWDEKPESDTSTGS